MLHDVAADRRAPIGITRVSSCLTLQERETRTNMFIRFTFLRVIVIRDDYDCRRSRQVASS